MKNNVYVRSNRSIKSISLIRILFLLPLLVYGFYKNGIYLYQKHYITMLGMFKPLVIVLGCTLIGILVNIFYEKIFKHNHDELSDVIFSSFHPVYGFCIGALAPVSINIILLFVVTFVLLFISKFIKNRINIVCLIFLVVYLISSNFFKFEFMNSYELSKVFSLEFMDYLIGKNPGGVASTHSILTLLALFGMSVTSNNKTYISVSSIITIIILFSGYAIFKNTNICPYIFDNNLIFILCFVATDYVTSSYTKKGMVLFGIIVGVLTFGLYFINPILAPILAVLITSLFNNLIDRSFYVK